MELNINSDEIVDLAHKYATAQPYPHLIIDNILQDDYALQIQEEIISLPESVFDRYSNPFEQKWTLRNKNALPPNCSKLFEYLYSDVWVKKLSKIAGIELINDPNKNFWGIHKYDLGDKLDIHVDAGIHPVAKLKKEITLGIYFSKNWKEEYGGYLELWSGENSKHNDAKLIECCHKVSPICNRMILFMCNDYSWHGNPIPVDNKNDSMRIFLTISYLSNRTNFENTRQKAFFVKLPNEPDDPEKDYLRLMRADPEKYKDIYRI